MQSTKTRQRTPRRNFRHHSTGSILRGTVKSDRSDRRYTVILEPTSGFMSCDCQGFRSYGHCKHVERFCRRNLNRIARGLLPKDEPIELTDSERFAAEMYASDADMAAYFGEARNAYQAGSATVFAGGY